MITLFFLEFIGIILGAITLPLEFVTQVFSGAVVPAFVLGGITTFYESIAIFQGILPLVATSGATGMAGTVGILDLFEYALLVITSLFTMYILFLALKMTPFLGVKPPQHK